MIFQNFNKSRLGMGGLINFQQAVIALRILPTREIVKTDHSIFLHLPVMFLDNVQ